PKTSGSRGIHIYVRVVPEQGFEEVRRAALALAREVERRMPGRATSKWWKEEREGVFIDYNQSARDRTVASAYSVRAVPDARVSCALDWGEVQDVEPEQLTLQTVPARLRERCDPSGGIDEPQARPGALLELAARSERGGVETPARYVAFGLLAREDEALLAAPFAQRRSALEELLARAEFEAAPVELIEASRSPEDAQKWLLSAEGAIAKERGAP